MGLTVEKLQNWTERVLTNRKIRIYKKKKRQQEKNIVVDWLEAFLWAAMVVLLINQYLFQAYQIPSGSMKDTLLIKDRIFVNKMIYGPELIPGMAKVPGFKTPKRGDVIIFENPTYISKGPAFDVTQRILYMLTLSMVDIDKDENGMPKAHFLIKRAVSEDGDTIRQYQGDLYIKARGESEFLPESEFKKYSHLAYGNKRLIDPSSYEAFKDFGEAYAFKEAGILIPDYLKEGASRLSSIEHNDPLEIDQWRQKARYQIEPFNKVAGSAWRQSEVTGRYIPLNYILPMGDNRDNSNDGRYFGPVSKNKILGQALFKYWPLNRMGLIK